MFINFVLSFFSYIVSQIFHSACELHTKWLSLKEKDEALAKIIQNKYTEIITMATSSITAKLTTYDMPALRTCVLGLWMVCSKLQEAYNHLHYNVFVLSVYRI